MRFQLEALWNRGSLLSSLVTGEALFPRRITLKSPNSAEMIDRFHEVRAWIAELTRMSHCRIEMREFKHRILGENTIPVELWVDSFDAAIMLIAKQKQVSNFSAMLELTRQRQPTLLDWLAKKPLRALELTEVWPRLLEIIAWLQAHPRPGVYLRQVDIPGVHSKFIEMHRGILTELLDIALPEAQVDKSVSGVGQFAKRYGFRDKPLRIRLRILDSGLAASLPGEDITLNADCFTRLDLGTPRVFITENEINFLAFPPHPNSLVIFGAGYGFDMLSQAQWLSGCRIHYWGDIDTHGFAILDQLRSQFEHVESFLMDRSTLLAFEMHWGQEDKPTLRDLPRLNSDEQSLYDDLRDNRIAANLRLEQEKIGFSWVEQALAKLKW